ncbi:efflux RND transporter periplasmic adaptor subunit [Azovibrio restrictus]|uniref:efflux RND transporter periplasmic adaptor subunit n=1 Tax=Azovibrio restrictus TaxID=146938 RepID=UPI0026EF56F6|nr:efflux RND transporter periplasmic adaptor subunit [Azovibrio restrictus]MDD3483758.1 efflux RND transporter periplasmic adaptor subunit [Azovibrio restrictus]
MSKPLSTWAALLAFLTLQPGAAALAHEGHEHAEPAAAMAAAPVKPVTGQPLSEAPLRLPDGSLFVPKSVQRRMGAQGLRTAPVASGNFPRVLSLPGLVIADPGSGGRVQTLQAGRLAAGPEGLAVLGQRVKKGQILAWLEPAAGALEKGAGQAALAELTAQESLLASRVARLEQLEGSVPAKDIEQARIELQSFRQKKAAVAGSLGREALRAPVDGVIGAANGVAGQVVDVREVVFEVFDPARLAVQAQAPDPAALAAGVEGGSLDLGQGVGVELAFVGMGRSLKAQSLPVLFRVQPQPDMPQLVLGQSVQVLARVRQSRAAPVLAIPASALVRDGDNQARVWVHGAPERFEARPVRVEPLDGTRVAVIQGLQAGEQVVRDGAVDLNRVR